MCDAGLANGGIPFSRSRQGADFIASSLHRGNMVLQQEIYRRARRSELTYFDSLLHHPLTRYSSRDWNFAQPLAIMLVHMKAVLFALLLSVSAFAQSPAVTTAAPVDHVI